MTADVIPLRRSRPISDGRWIHRATRESGCLRTACGRDVRGHWRLADPYPVNCPDCLDVHECPDCGFAWTDYKRREPCPGCSLSHHDLEAAAELLDRLLNA